MSAILPMKKVGRRSLTLFVTLVFPLFFLQGCSHLFYQGSGTKYADPSQLGLAFQEFYLTSQDGTRLGAWYLPAQPKLEEGETPRTEGRPAAKSKSSVAQVQGRTADALLGVDLSGKPLAAEERTRGLVVQFHGNAENLSSHFLSVAWLVRQGFSVLCFDYRGFGASDGQANPAGVHQDAIAALEWAIRWKRSRSESSPVHVLGQSLGGAVLARALGEFAERDSVSSFTLEGTFDSYRRIATDRLRASALTFLLQPLGWVLISDRYAPEVAYPRLSRIPGLVIHGECDPVIPFSFGERIFQKLSQGAEAPREFWPIPAGGHIDTFQNQALLYQKRFVDFLVRSDSN